MQLQTKVRNIGWCVLLLALVACGKKSKPAPKVAPAYTTSSEESKANCESDTTTCSTVSLEYPQLISSSDYPDETAAKINNRILQEVNDQLGMMNDPNETGDIASSIELFHNDYAEMVGEMGGYGMPWSVEVTSEVLNLDETYLSVVLHNYSFTGGAHPNTFSTAQNFLVQSGDTLDVLDFVLNQDEFLQVAETHFRRSRQISPTASLSDEGFFWGESFQLPENIGISPDGLQFLYNPYEIAAYVFGPTDFIIPYADLVDVLDDQLPQHFSKQ